MPEPIVIIRYGTRAAWNCGAALGLARTDGRYHKRWIDVTS